MSFKPKFHCERCGYDWEGQWRAEGDPPPKRCASCRSKYWQRPRRYHGGFACSSVENPSTTARLAREAAKAAQTAEWDRQKKELAKAERARIRKLKNQRRRRRLAAAVRRQKKKAGS